MNISHSAVEEHFGFWARLPLVQKLLAAFGGLFVLAMLIAVVTLFGLNQTSAAYEDTLTQGVSIRSITDLVTIDLLSARREGKDYLLRWQEQGVDAAYENYATLFLKDVAAMRTAIQQLAAFAPQAPTASQGALTEVEYQAEIATLTEQTDLYQQSFVAYIEVTRARGSDENTGLEGAMRTATHALEAKINGQTGLEALEITLLQLRRSEKDYINRGAQSYIDQVHALLPQLKTQISQADQFDAATQAELLAQADIYLKNFDDIVAADQQLLAHDAELADAALALQTSIAKIEKLGETLATDDINSARANSRQTLTFSLGTVVLVLVISIVLALGLARQLTLPILALTSTAQQISGGKFDIQAQVTSADEIGALAQTFNLMTTRLGQAFEDVRRRALAVQTSAEISRRLSAATSPRQLAVEVVEQLKSAFDYYHAHIYFFDESGETLVMAGGTGDAGAKMLASGHSIPRGRGLVGRAAETNAPVLVEDVAKTIGWLPNPLLPETRSELAVPVALGSQVLGVVDIQQNRVGGLDENDVSLLQSIANQVAISLQNARSYEHTRAQAELESMVNSIGQKIQRAATVEDTLQVAIRELGLALGAERASVNLQASRGVEKQIGGGEGVAK